jgi:hypothetical protein
MSYSGNVIDNGDGRWVFVQKLDLCGQHLINDIAEICASGAVEKVLKPLTALRGGSLPNIISIHFEFGLAELGNNCSILRYTHTLTPANSGYHSTFSGVARFLRRWFYNEKQFHIFYDDFDVTRQEHIKLSWAYVLADFDKV